MTVSVLLILLGAVGLYFVFRLVRTGVLVKADASEDDLATRLRPVDLEAFRNLTDPEEDKFLRDNLSAQDFRVVQRERLRAAMQYVACAAHNAGVLLQVGTAASHSLDPRTAEAGRSLVDRAVQIRWYAILVMFRLRVNLVFPQLELSPAEIADQYQQLSSSLNQLGRMHSPLRGVRLSATV